jgi:hypothetical protein
MGMKLGLSPILGEKCRLKFVKNTLLRKIFGPTRDDVTGE